MGKKSSKSYDHLLAFVLDQPWALTDSMRTIVAGILARHLAGDAQAASDFERVEYPARQQPATSVALIPVHGVIAPRMNLMSDISGGCTYEELRSQLRDAVADPAIGTIVLDIDSPGGSCAGASEFAQEVLAARAKKPVIAVAQYQMCSAAYWIGACATEVVAPVSALLGSIGVFAIHEDLSKALEQEGIKLTHIAAGKYKVDGNSAEPLSDSARARIEAHVTATYQRMTSDIALGRGVSPAVVRATYGEGAVVQAHDALSAGMIDRIATLDDTLARVLTSGTPTMLRADTSQEPSPATDQDQRRDQQWRHTVERAFLDWSLTTS
jgi:signal peptide peptidase SppA